MTLYFVLTGGTSDKLEDISSSVYVRKWREMYVKEYCEIKQNTFGTFNLSL